MIRIVEYATRPASPRLDIVPVPDECARDLLQGSREVRIPVPPLVNDLMPLHTEATSDLLGAHKVIDVDETTHCQMMPQQTRR